MEKNLGTYQEKLKSLSKSQEDTLSFIEAKEDTLKKAKALLKQKEQELSNLIEYVYLLQTVVQALKFEISEIAKELDYLKSDTEQSKVYGDSLKSIQGLLHNGEVQAETGVYGESKTTAKKPELGIQLQTYSSLQRDSESLTLAENSEGSDEETNDSEESDKGTEESAKLSTEAPVSLSTEETVKSSSLGSSSIETQNKIKDPSDKFLAAEIEKDSKYLEQVKWCCVHPVQNTSIWERRVLVKHYMELGMSQVQEIVTRYNAWANHTKAVPGTFSSISKDMMKIMNGEFILQRKYADAGIAGVVMEFKPSLMLTCAEIGQLNETLRAMKAKYGGRTDYIKKYVNSYARKNLNNMSSFKVRAVDSFIDSQL